MYYELFYVAGGYVRLLAGCLLLDDILVIAERYIALGFAVDDFRVYGVC